jgi:hypothetical protein
MKQVYSTTLLIAGGLTCLVGSGCGDSEHGGPLVRLSGTFNAWAKGERAAALRWDGRAYSGVVDLPGDAIELRIYYPYTDALVGSAEDNGAPAHAVPDSLPTADPKDGPAPALRLDTPVPARYQVTYDPGTHRLRVDLAEGAEAGQQQGAAALITALRGSDQLSTVQLQARASQLHAALREMELPLVGGKDESQGVTFLYLGQPDSTDLSVVGNFNEWTAGRTPMHLMLDGSVAYCGRVAVGVRLDYRFDLHGLRSADPNNPEVVWDGANLPTNLKNVLGGNMGEFNSVARSPGYVEQGSRLRQMKVAGRDVYVYLPRGFDPSREYQGLYVHDGKDALVRGRYNQTLDQLIRDSKIPPVIAVFVPAQSEAEARLAEFAHVRDPLYFRDIEPRAEAYEKFLYGSLLPEVERRYPVRKSGRAMLGIDLAGVFSMYTAWKDPEARFTRIASQSGRFAWGGQTVLESPYTELIKKTDRSQVIERLSFDWADGDQFQVGPAHEITLKRHFEATPAYKDKVQFIRQSEPLPLPSPTVWDNWRSRLEQSLIFLLKDK